MSETEDVVDITALSHWMDDAGLGKGQLQDPYLLAGGTQNILLKFQRDGRDYLLRRPPLHLRKNSNETMLREARVLEALHGSNVPHPDFIAACDDPSILGACFYLMEPVTGFNATTGLPTLHKNDPAVRRRMGFSMVEGITALGALDYKSVGLQDFGKPEGFIERQVPRWLAHLNGYSEIDAWPGPGELPGIDLIPIWLEDNRPKSFTPGIMHGDYHLANVLFNNNSPELAAIVDWELCTIGDPLLDVGWLMAMWHDTESDAPARVEPWDGFPTIDELIKHYAERTERNMDSIAWYGVLACFKLGVILEGTYVRACAGQAPKEIGERLHENTIGLFTRALKMMAR